LPQRQIICGFLVPNLRNSDSAGMQRIMTWAESKAIETVPDRAAVKT
jgi:hypothetical protein